MDSTSIAAAVFRPKKPASFPSRITSDVDPPPLDSHSNGGALSPELHPLAAAVEPAATEGDAMELEVRGRPQAVDGRTRRRGRSRSRSRFREPTDSQTFNDSAGFAGEGAPGSSSYDSYLTETPRHEDPPAPSEQPFLNAQHITHAFAPTHQPGDDSRIVNGTSHDEPRRSRAQSPALSNPMSRSKSVEDRLRRLNRKTDIINVSAGTNRAPSLPPRTVARRGSLPPSEISKKPSNTTNSQQSNGKLRRTYSLSLLRGNNQPNTQNTTTTTTMGDKPPRAPATARSRVDRSPAPRRRSVPSKLLPRAPSASATTGRPRAPTPGADENHSNQPQLENGSSGAPSTRGRPQHSARPNEAPRPANEGEGSVPSQDLTTRLRMYLSKSRSYGSDTHQSNSTPASTSPALPKTANGKPLQQFQRVPITRTRVAGVQGIAKQTTLSPRTIEPAVRDRRDPRSNRAPSAGPDSRTPVNRGSLPILQGASHTTATKPTPVTVVGHPAPPQGRSKSVALSVINPETLREFQEQTNSSGSVPTHARRRLPIRQSDGETLQNGGSWN